MEYQQNNSSNTYQSKEQQPQNSFTELNSAPPKWLSAVFKTWAILNFLGIAIVVVLLTSKLISKLKIIIWLTEFSASFPLILGGLYVAVFVLFLISLILFWGAFKLRKWVLPILIIFLLFSAINIIILLFKLQFSTNLIFDIIGDLVIIAVALLAFIFRRYFTGDYRKLSLQIIFFIFIVPILTFEILTLLFPDLQKVNDSDLIQSNFSSINKDQNFYYILVGISNQVYEPIGQANDRYKQFLEDKIWDQAEVDSILNQNENSLNEARKAALFSYYQCPSYENDLSYVAELCPFIYLLRIARIASLSALSKAQEGDLSAAIDDALIPVRIGQLLQDAPLIILVDYLIGDEMKRIGLNTMQIILTKYQISSEVLLARINELQKYTQNEEGLKNVFRFEYQLTKNSLAFINKINSNFYIQPNRFFSDMADDIRQKMKITDTPCYQLETALEQYQKDFDKKNPKIVIWKLPFMKNAFFEAFIKERESIMFVSLSSIQNKRCELDLMVERTRLQMALSAYKSDRGRFPISQSELIPNYLSKELLNPYTNTVFVFNKDTGIINQDKVK